VASLRDKPWEEIQIGEDLPRLKKEITQETINRYAVASEDPNPLHTDPEFAKTTPFKGTIAHGTMYLAYVSEMMMQWFPHLWLTGGYMEVSFLAPARPGDTLTVFGKVAERSEGKGVMEVTFNVGVETQDGKKIIVGIAKVVWP
jgi:3-hydroxybutyryl-CoA dehydratase